MRITGRRYKTGHFFLIDVLKKAMIDIGLNVKHDGWTENDFSDPPRDKCEWLDVKFKDDNGEHWTVHFYFNQNCSRLNDIAVFKGKKLEEQRRIIPSSEEYEKRKQKKHELQLQSKMH